MTSFRWLTSENNRDKGYMNISPPAGKLWTNGRRYIIAILQPIKCGLNAESDYKKSLEIYQVDLRSFRILNKFLAT